jgi:hypothetical protein
MVVQPRLVTSCLCCLRVDFGSDFITVLVPATHFAAVSAVAPTEIAFGARAPAVLLTFMAAIVLRWTAMVAWLRTTPCQRKTTALMRAPERRQAIGSDG